MSLSSSSHRTAAAVGGALVLGAVWLWPLPQLGVPPFSRHMVMHMAVVAVAAPMLALALAGSRYDLVARAPGLCAAIPASIVEMIGVWAWHAPQLHHAARHEPLALALEQGTFLGSGLFLWMAALGGTPGQRRARAMPGVIALLLTSMHMTLLGALIALTPRLLYGHAHESSTLSPIVDQQLGGVIMLFVGGAAYLAGGLGLTRHALLLGRAGEGEA